MILARWNCPFVMSKRNRLKRYATGDVMEHVMYVESFSQQAWFRWVVQTALLTFDCI